MADAAGSNRDRAIIHTLWSSGLRVSTLCALNIGDIRAELESSIQNPVVPVYPEMKNRVPDACKGDIPYFSYLSSTASDALRVYLAERMEQFGKPDNTDPLFHSDWHLWDKDERSSKRLGRRGIGIIVKESARLSGIKDWRYVTPHCLRKAFESVLRSQTIDGGRLDKGTQEFLFGHILPGSQDVYYDKSKIEEHRALFARLDFRADMSMPSVSDKLIKVDELEQHFAMGWGFVSGVGDGLVVVRRHR